MRHRHTYFQFHSRKTRTHLRTVFLWFFTTLAVVQVSTASNGRIFYAWWMARNVEEAFIVRPDTFLEGLRKTTKILVRITNVPAEIRTGYLPHRTQNLYRFFRLVLCVKRQIFYSPGFSPQVKLRLPTVVWFILRVFFIFCNTQHMI
jgi:hypothetical protein